MYHTDPFNADTDGDGLTDGTDPLDPNSHPGETSLLVINEVLYDYSGDDGGHEFVELYNNRGTAVDLSGYKLQASVQGRFKTSCVILRGKVIAPQSYFLIGEPGVRDISLNLPDMVATLELQNGDQNDPAVPYPGKLSPTDGVRLVGLG